MQRTENGKPPTPVAVPAPAVARTAAAPPPPAPREYEGPPGFLIVLLRALSAWNV